MKNWQSKISRTCFILLAVLIGFGNHAIAFGKDLYIPPIREIYRDFGTEVPRNLKKHKHEVNVSLYIQSVEIKIARMLAVWPATGVKARIYGDVTVELVIRRDGSLAGVFASDDHAISDRPLMESAFERVRSAAPFQPPPDSVLQGRNSVRFSIGFRFLKPEFG